MNFETCQFVTLTLLFFILRGFILKIIETNIKHFALHSRGKKSQSDHLSCGQIHLNFYLPCCQITLGIQGNYIA